MTMRTGAASLLLAAILGIEGAARADAIEGQAKIAFEEGTARFAEGAFDEAAAAFRRAYALKPSWRLLYNIGQSEAAAKRHGPALDAFEKYLSLGGDEIAEPRRAEVLAQIEQLRPVVGTLQIEAPDGALVLVDGVERGLAPLPGAVRVAAGVDHVVEVRSGASVLARRTVSVGGRESLTVQITAGREGAEEPAVAPPPPPPPPPATTEIGPPAAPPVSAMTKVGWVAFGLGAATAVAGVITGAAALSKNGDLDAACNDADGCPKDDYADALSTRDALATTSTVTLAVGAAVAVTGIALLIAGRRRGEAPSSGAVSVAPFGGPSAIGLTTGGRF